MRSATSTVATDLPQPPLPPGLRAETVTAVTHYTDRLFSFRMTRAQDFRFRSGEFAMIGLPSSEPGVMRAYSIASPDWDEELEFFSIKAPGGALTEHLQRIQPGDRIVLRPRTTGTLVLDALRPGRRLWLFSTGTGIAPFASVLRDPKTYERFDQVILTQTCRERAELAFGYELNREVRAHEFLGPIVKGRFAFYPTTTREPSSKSGRITDLITSGELFRDFGFAGFDPADRMMICGSIDFNRDMKAILDAGGFEEGSNSTPADYVIERAFVS